MKRWLAVLSMALLPLPALALTQPDGTVIPTDPTCSAGKPIGLAPVFACACDQAGVCNIGAPCHDQTSCENGLNAVCETTLWHVFGDDPCLPAQLSGLNPKTDASITPETFQPTCPLDFTLVSRGGAIFYNIFGWYNVTGTSPALTDLHPMLACDAAIGSTVKLDIQNDAAYLGGQIGFFLATPESLTKGGTCADSDCCASLERIKAGQGRVYYSQRQYNPDDQGAASIIHLLVYDSKVTEHKFYFAWEDLFNGCDNEFANLVTSVYGVECTGGGLECATGLKGRCAFGLTTCTDGALVCKAVFGGEPERCDAVDNNCDDLIDNEAPCPPNMLCHNGQCVGNCNSGEFPCANANTACDRKTGLCLDVACVGRDCPAGTVCRAGQCRAPCDGVVCPFGRTCFLDECIDLCETVVCNQGEVCRSGLCFPACGRCNGVACSLPLVCKPDSGRCLDPSCKSECAFGTHCDNGTCRDDCDGAVCPAGQTCIAGKCMPTQQPLDAGPPPTDAIVIITDTGPTLADVKDTGSAVDGPEDALPDRAVGSAYDPGAPVGPRCGCQLPHVRSTGPMLLGLAIAALVPIRRRRRL